MEGPSRTSSRPGSAASSTNNDPIHVDPPSTSFDGSRRRSQPQQPRQLLSCTKCRERKVKCDRTKPCSSCCARGAPKECRFIPDGGDYVPIQQSYELRKLRAENIRLRERLRACKIPIDDGDADQMSSPDSQQGDRMVGMLPERRAAHRRRLKASEASDSIYFGSPGLASIVSDFASINMSSVSSQSLAHLMPRGSGVYSAKTPPAYPFPTVFPMDAEECTTKLLEILPAREEIYGYLHSFERRVQVCAFPHVPLEITKSEVDRFLSDDRKHALASPDMLGLLFAALALGSQYSTWDKSGGQWDADILSAEARTGRVYIAAAMQALRISSFMHKPTLLSIQAMIMIGPVLTNSGQFLDAWTLFGMTIRMAHSIGLHRHPKYLDPAPPTPSECSLRQTLWWWLLHMDQEYSMTLGRPLGISGIGDCPPPLELTTDPQMLRFGDFVQHFTVLARQILSSDCLNVARIDAFTDLLHNLLETMPERLHFNASWIDQNTDIPEWPLGAMAAVSYCQVHTYLIILNRQRIDKGSSQSTPQNQASESISPGGLQRKGRRRDAPRPRSDAVSRGRALVLSSSEDLLTAFLFFHARLPAALICWTIGQQAYNSCMMLLLDAMETGNISRIRKVESAYVVFLELQKNGVHDLATIAVDRISLGLSELSRMQSQSGLGPRSHDTASSPTTMSPTPFGEITQQKSSSHDAVMGNTGMFLLEDPGLQAFVPEAFAPFACAQPADLLESVAAHTASKPRAKPPGEGKSTRGPHGSMSTQSNDQSKARTQSFQSRPKSLSLPLVRSASSNSTQPQHRTTSTASARATARQRPRPELRSRMDSRHSTPSHMRQQSYSSAQDTHHLDSDVAQDIGAHMASSPAQLAGQYRASHGSRRAAGWTCMNETVDSMTWTPEQVDLSHTPQGGLLSSSTAPSVLHLGNPSVHPSWAARSAAPITSVCEPATSATYEQDRAQTYGGFSERSNLSSSLWPTQYTFVAPPPASGFPDPLAGRPAHDPNAGR